MGITNNAINNTSQTLAIGTGTPNDTHYILYAKKDQADASVLRIENLNSQGRSAVIANCNSTNGANQASIGFYQYGSNYSDQFAAANTSVIFSNAYSAGMTLACNFGKLLMIDANDVTNVSLTTTGGQYKGNNTNVTPPAGFIGELITNNATTGTLTGGSTTNITSIALTAGIWDIMATVKFATSGTVAALIAWKAAISTANNNLTGAGENGFTDSGGFGPVNGTNSASIVVGTTRVTLSGNATYYLNCSGNATTFTNCTALGIIRAVRVG